MRLRLAFVTGFLLLLCCPAYAANHFIRAGAAGASTGADYTDAWPTFAAVTLTRGDTYYVADGNYNESLTLSQAESGTTGIIIRKCTAANHGTESGYVATYCDGDAIINLLNVTTGYWTLVGTCAGVPPFTTGTCGLHFKYNGVLASGSVARIGNGSDALSTVVLNGIEVEGANNTAVCEESPSVKALTSNVTIQHSLITKTNATKFSGTTSPILEYSQLSDNYSDGSCHGELIALNGVSTPIIRYNFLIRGMGTAIIATPGGVPHTISSPEIYGNVGGCIAAATCNDGIVSILADTTVSGTMKFYQNSWVGNGVGFPAGNLRIDAAASVNALDSKNNLWWNWSSVTAASGAGITWTYNAYYDVTTLTDADANKQTASGDPFTASGSANYHLVANTSTRTTTANDPIFDADGVQITNSRGAFQFITGGAPATSYNPSSLTFAQTPVGHGTVTQTITLTEVGNSALTVSSVAASGTNAADFHVTSTCASVSALGTCTITIFFNPGAAGARSGSVTITSDAASSPDVLTLSGTAVTKSSIALVGVPQ